MHLPLFTAPFVARYREAWLTTLAHLALAL